MTLRLRDTLTREVRPIEPLEPGRVRMYTCGPTVYRYAHVGNLRSYLLADLIRRVLLYHGLEVFHVKNITDVGHLRDDQFDRGEDRMLVQAGPGAQVDRRDRRRLRGRVPRRRGARQHPPRPRLSARDRAHPRDARPRRAARGCGVTPTAPTTTTSTTPSRRSRATENCRATRSTISGRATGPRATSSTTSATPPISHCGRPPASSARSSGRRAGARASRAGTSSARRWPSNTSASGSTSIPAASTTSSRTTRTRSRSRRRWWAGHPPPSGSTASTC